MEIDPKITSALIGGVAGSIVSLASSYIITKLKIKQEIFIWNTEFSINYSKLLVSDPAAAKQLAKQFSVGLIIVRNKNGSTDSKNFIPYQCKVSIGRSQDNDIVLKPLTVSRDHGIIFCRGNKVIYRDLSPLNKTSINGIEINDPIELKSGDIITVGEVILEYEALV